MLALRLACKSKENDRERDSMSGVFWAFGHGRGCLSLAATALVLSLPVGGHAAGFDEGQVRLLALDSATQRAVIRIADAPPRVVARGDALVEVSARVVKVLDDRVEFEVDATGRRERL